MRCANQGSNKKKNLRITVNSRAGREDGVPVEVDAIVRPGRPFGEGRNGPVPSPFLLWMGIRPRGGVAKYKI
jgi:hypothetical protein